MQKRQELRQQSKEELQTLLSEESRALFEMRNQSKMSKEVKQPHLFRQKKKQIARLLTLIQEKSREQV